MNDVDSVPSATPSRAEELEEILAKLTPTISPSAASCLRHLAAFSAAPAEIEFPKRKMAGVLVLLHVNPLGDLSVTLTTRSMRLRSHPGDTALPGGRYEETDPSIEYTALREANEEISLPLTPSSSLFHLTTLPAFTSRTLLVVVPTLYLLTTPLPPLLANPDEVDAIFHLPLRSFLALSSPSRLRLKDSIGAEILQHAFEDFVWLEERKYRLHHFSHADIPSPVTGLTADILISTALVGFYGLSESEEEGEEGERLGFVRRAEGQMSWKEIVRTALGMEGQQGLRDKRTSST